MGSVAGYKIILDGKSAQAINEMPHDARVHLVSLVDRLQCDPWATFGEPAPATPKWQLRVADCLGYNLLLAIDPDACEVCILGLSPPAMERDKAGNQELHYAQAPSAEASPSYASMGKEIDEDLRQWRIQGMNGSPSEREHFLKQCFHGARFNGRAALLAAPYLSPPLTREEVLERLLGPVMDNIAIQGRETGYTEEQNAAYIHAHRQGYLSAAEEFGL